MINRLRQRKPFRTAVRQIANGFVTLLIAYLAFIQGSLDQQYIRAVPVVHAMLTNISKAINTKILNDIGVEK